MRNNKELSSVDKDLQSQINKLENKITQLKKEMEDSNAIVEIVIEEENLAECRGWSDPYIDDFSDDIDIKEAIHGLLEALIKHEGSLISNDADICFKGEMLEFDYPQIGGTIKDLEAAHFPNLYTTATDYKDHTLGVDWIISVPKAGYDDVQSALSICGL